MSLRSTPRSSSQRLCYSVFRQGCVGLGGSRAWWAVAAFGSPGPESPPKPLDAHFAMVTDGKSHGCCNTAARSYLGKPGPGCLAKTRELRPRSFVASLQLNPLPSIQRIKPPHRFSSAEIHAFLCWPLGLETSFRQPVDPALVPSSTGIHGSFQPFHHRSG